MRGKVKALVEFGAKLDLSIDAEGYTKIYPLVPARKVPVCRMRSKLMMSEPDTISNEFLQIRYIGRGLTELFAKSMT